MNKCAGFFQSFPPWSFQYILLSKRKISEGNKVITALVQNPELASQSRMRVENTARQSNGLSINVPIRISGKPCSICSRSRGS